MFSFGWALLTWFSLVRFDPDAPVGAQLRIWDRVQEDLVERQLDGSRSPSSTLGLWWVVLGDLELDAVLRLAEDAEGQRVLPTRAEAEALGRDIEARARATAEARIAELEAELRRRGG